MIECRTKKIQLFRRVSKATMNSSTALRNLSCGIFEVHNVANFLAALPGKTPLVSILPYRNIAVHNYYKLGSDYKEFNMAEPDDEEIERAVHIFRRFGVETEVGG